QQHRHRSRHLVGHHRPLRRDADKRLAGQRLRARPPREAHGSGPRRSQLPGARTALTPMGSRARALLLAALVAIRAGGAAWATSESDGHGHTDVLGGDENLARAHAKAAASNFVNDPGGSITRYPWKVAGLESVAAVAAERFGARPLTAADFDHGNAWIDYRGG